ncbi:MAG TPA: glycoside hydrolase family 6 protein [Anaerolineales bacterium]
MTRSIKLHSLFVSLLVLAILLSSMALPTGVVHAINTPWLSVSGRFIRDPQDNNVVLRGVSLVDVSVANSRPRNAVTLTNMVTDDANSWYARVVRFPVYPNAIDGQPGWIANPDSYFNNHLDPAIQNCISRQIYCIIDWHYISDYTSNTIDTTTRAFWSYVAPRYANTPNVIFELYNEPINPDNWSTWKTTAQPWVNLIRSLAPNNLILIGGPRWSQNLSSAASDPFVGSNLVYVAHIYPEHGGQSTWDSWFGNAANSVPFFITEWGWQQGGATPTNGTLSGYGVPFSTYMESKGLSWTAWVFDQFWQPVMFDQNYNLLGGENYMGQYTKDFLFQHRNDNLPGGSGPTNTPTRTNTPGGPTATSTRTNTPVSSGNLKVQLHLSGSDTAERSDFYYRVVNTGNSAQSNISVRVYFTLDGSQPASKYVLEKWWDGSNIATISGPTQASGSTYYFTINYGSASLAAGASWEFQTTLHLNDWSSSYSGVNDWWHTTGTLPAAYTDWSTIPTYVNSSLVWGSTPGDTPVPTATLTRTNTPVSATNTSTRTNTPSVATNTATRTNTPVGASNTPTRTNTPMTATLTPTRTNTPSGPATLRVQYRAADTNAGDNQIKPHFNIVNTGSSSVPLSELKIRYWYTREGTVGQNFWCDFSAITGNCGNITGTFVPVSPLRTGADFYLEVGFNAAAGSIPAAGQSGEIQARFAKTDWSNYNETGDYSFDPTKTSFTDWDHVTLYRNGNLVWGIEPSGGGPTNTPTRTNTPGGPTATQTSTATSTRTNTPTGPTSTPTRTSTPNGPTFTPTRTPTNPPAGTHLDNPFVGATFYRNVDYVASVNAAADLQGGTLAAQMRQVANYPTFVWLDSIDAVNGTNGYPRSLAGHLNAALAQGANAIGIVIYDLPNRDCSALASNGELLIAQNGLNRYKTEYIDAIFNTISQSQYSNLRIVMVIEPDSLPNLVTNLSFAKCSEAQSTGAYVQGVQYAIGTLRSLSNTYAYIDVAHAAWLGWPSNFGPFVTLLKQVGVGIPGGNSKVDGFISNTANYNPVDEPFMDANTMVSGQPVRSLQGWYDWNDYIDEQPYIIALRNALTTGSDAYPTSVGVIIDTSRNGWGGPNRPTGPSTSTDLRTFVMATRIDKRIHKGNWCNQDGAGIGERPVANPITGVDAFVWVKPPGESDGSSSFIPQGPDNPGGKGFDRMCDPTYTGNQLNGNNLTGALPNAPVSGRWFQNQFIQLVQNAYPPFP